jgi:TPR repeat protein
MNMHIVSFAAALSMFSLFGVAKAGQLEDAVAAARAGDYATAVRLYRPLADQGNAVAQSGLAFLYATGHGVPQDYAQAVIWFRKAADQGNAGAQRGLGMSYTISG